MFERISIIGNVNIDVILGRLARLPDFGQEVIVSERKVRTAGAAGNTAMALAALGVTPLVVGVVGKDLLGDRIIEELTTAGVDIQGLVRAPNDTTGVSYALVSDTGERAFVTYMGVLNEFSMSTIMSNYVLLAKSAHVLITGYFLMPGIEFAEWVTLLERLKADGKHVLFDCGWDPQGWPQANIVKIRELLALVDTFLPNHEELKYLSDSDDPFEGARRLLATGVKEIVAKCGPYGSVFVSSNEQIRHPGFDVEVYDTAGAGDTFNAGLLYMLSKGSRTCDALGFANAVASLAIADGNRRYPSLEAVQKFLNSSKTADRVIKY